MEVKIIELMPDDVLKPFNMPEIPEPKTFEKFYGKLELDEKTADEIIEMGVWD